MTAQASFSLFYEEKDDAKKETMAGFCQCCGKSIRLESSTQRFCSSECKATFESQMLRIRRKKRNAYQKRFRSQKYKSEIKHIRKIDCPKCSRSGYLVRYTVRNRETERIVSMYETVRHQVTEGGKSILRGQCYLRSIAKDEQVESQELNKGIGEPHGQEGSTTYYDEGLRVALKKERKS